MTLDTSDLDQYMGVPMEPGELKEEVQVNDIRRWVSLVTIELRPRDAGTHLSHTEHYAFLAWTGDGRHDVAHLKGGTRLQLNGLLAAVSNP